MKQSDSITLDRGQYAELYTGGGVLRLIVDHPSNAPLIGTCAAACLVRAAALTVAAGDRRAEVYASRGGAAQRIATATTIRLEDDAVGLIDWRVAPGFEHLTAALAGATVHRVTRSVAANPA